MKFMVDPREHCTKGLLKETLKPLQGPALLAYNDATFTPEDWEGIGDLSQSRKAEDVLKVGRFGIGFQSVHHITGRLQCIVFCELRLCDSAFSLKILC